MSASRFLASREIARRSGRAALASLVVAAAVALSVGLELLGRARERAVEGELDRAGPALRVIPAGVSAADAAALRFDGASLPARARDAVAATSGVRAVEGRAVLRDADSGWAVIAMDGPRSVVAVAPGHVVPGSGLAERTGLTAGDTARVLGRELVVSAVAPTLADASDFAAFVHQSDAPAGFSELRVFLEPGAAAEEVERAVRSVLPDANVIRADRGEVAAGGLQASVAAHREAVHLVTALVAMLALLIATHLDVAERRRELALLAAIGGTRHTLAAVVVWRAALCALIGAAAGTALAASFLAPSADVALPALVNVALPAVLVAVVLAAIAATPVALATAAHDPARQLQES